MLKSSKEFKQLQRERIMKSKPWLKTKGAKTPEGKAISKMNALKTTPTLNRIMKEYRALMKHQKELNNLVL